MLTSRELYDAAVAAAIPMDNHESDLYLKATPEAVALVRQYEGRSNCSGFTSQIDGERWIEVPFAFVPWWDKRHPHGADYLKDYTRAVREGDRSAE